MWINLKKIDILMGVTVSPEACITDCDTMAAAMVIEPAS
jgi:hypothetical protein